MSTVPILKNLKERTWFHEYRSGKLKNSAQLSRSWFPYSPFKTSEALLRFSEKDVQQYLPIFSGEGVTYSLKRHLCVKFQGKLLFSESKGNLTPKQCQEKRKENEKLKEHSCPSFQLLKSSWKRMRSIVHRLRRLCVQPSKGTWKPASIMNRFSGRWVYPLLSLFFPEMNWLGFQPRNMSSSPLKPRTGGAAPSAFLPACHPKPDSGTKVCSAFLPPSCSSLPTCSSQAFQQGCLFSHYFISRVANLPLLPFYNWRVQLKATTFVILEGPPSPSTPDPSERMSPYLDSWVSMPYGQTCTQPHLLSQSEVSKHIIWIWGKKNLMSYLFWD